MFLLAPLTQSATIIVMFMNFAKSTLHHSESYPTIILKDAHRSCGKAWPLGVCRAWSYPCLSLFYLFGTKPKNWYRLLITMNRKHFAELKLWRVFICWLQSLSLFISSNDISIKKFTFKSLYCFSSPSK